MPQTHDKKSRIASAVALHLTDTGRLRSRCTALESRAWSLIFTDDPKKMNPDSETAARRAVMRSSTARSVGPRSTAERAGTIAIAFTVTCDPGPQSAAAPLSSKAAVGAKRYWVYACAVGSFRFRAQKLGW